MSKLYSGAEIVFKCLEAQDVEYIFGYPGGAVLPLYDALFENKKDKQAITYSRNVSRAKRMLKELRGEDKSDPMSLEDTEMPEPQETMEEPMKEPEQQGLMARRM